MWDRGAVSDTLWVLARVIIIVPCFRFLLAASVIDCRPQHTSWLCYFFQRPAQGPFGYRQQEVTIPRNLPAAVDASAGGGGGAGGSLNPVSAPVVAGNATTRAGPTLSLRPVISGRPRVFGSFRRHHQLRRRLAAAAAAVDALGSAAGSIVGQAGGAVSGLLSGTDSFEAVLFSPAGDLGVRRAHVAVLMHAMIHTPDHYKR